MPSGYTKLIVDPNHTTYDDGDILGACNHRLIREMACSRVCFARGERRQLNGLNKYGFLPHTHITQDWCSNVSEIKHERLSRDTVRFTLTRDNGVYLAGHSIEVTTGVPFTDLRGKPNRQMHVDLYYKRRIQTFQKGQKAGQPADSTGLPIFSDDGDFNKVVMYTGPSDKSDAKLNTIWAAVEAKTAFTEATETSWMNQPAWRYQRKRAIIRVDDFTDEERGLLTATHEERDDVTITRVVERVSGPVESTWGVKLSATLPTRITGGRLEIGRNSYEITATLTADSFEVSGSTSRPPVNGAAEIHVNLAKRKNKIDWKNDLSLTQQEKDDVLDDRKDPDLRTATEYERATVVTVKTR